MSTSPGFLDVKMRSKILEQPRRVVGALGGQVSLTCRLRVDPSLVEEAEIYWTKDGRGTLRERTTLGRDSFGKRLLVCLFSSTIKSQNVLGAGQMNPSLSEER